MYAVICKRGKEVVKDLFLELDDAEIRYDVINKMNELYKYDDIRLVELTIGKDLK